MAIVTIVGSGMMGSALAFPARENGNEVRLVGTHLDREIIDACIKTDRHPKFEKDFPEGLKYYQIEDLEEALNDADMVIGGVSSFGVEWFGEYVLPRIPEGVPVLSVTKGLMDTPEGKLLTYPEVWKKMLEKTGKKVSINAIGGPCTSYELVFHDQTMVAFCGDDMETLKKMKEIMATDYYHISLSTDVVGIESAVALKNGYALGIALAPILCTEDEYRALYACRCNLQKSLHLICHIYARYCRVAERAYHHIVGKADCKGNEVLQRYRYSEHQQRAVKALVSCQHFSSSSH